MPTHNSPPRATVVKTVTSGAGGSGGSAVLGATASASHRFMRCAARPSHFRMTGHSSDTIPTAQRAPGRQRHGAAPERSIQRKNLEQRLTRSPSLIEGRLSGHEGESCSFRLSVLSPAGSGRLETNPTPPGTRRIGWQTSERRSTGTSGSTRTRARSSLALSPRPR
jgi:hypothetical protein